MPPKSKEAAPPLPMQCDATRPPISSLAEKHFRRNVVSIVMDEQRRMLLCLRKDREGWHCVQGGVETGDEDWITAAARELYEEVGLHAFTSDGARRIIDRDDAPAVDAAPASRRPPRTEACVLPLLRYVGDLPLLPTEEPLRHWFPVGKALSHVRRGIYGQQQRCLVFATWNGDALMQQIDLRGLGGQPREFIATRWHSLDDVTGLKACVPPCKTDVFGTIAIALRRVIQRMDTSDAVEESIASQVDALAAAYRVAVRQH